MTNAEYHETPAVSKSDLDLISRSPMHYKLAKQSPKEQTPSMLLGSVVHKLVLEPESFDAEYIAAPECDRRTKAGKEAWAEFMEKCTAEQTVIDAATLSIAQEIAEAVRKHPLAAKLLQGGKAETSHFWNDDNGIECKCRPDYLREDIRTVVDLKTTQNSSPEEFMKSAYNFRYHVQAAWYLDGLRRLGFDVEHFMFIAVETKPPYPVVVYNADELMMQLGRAAYKEDMETYRTCLTTGNWYAYEEKPEVHSLSIPDWVARKYF